jgi:hypothetical protein
LREELEREAKADNRSLSNYIVKILMERKVPPLKEWAVRPARGLFCFPEIFEAERMMLDILNRYKTSRRLVTEANNKFVLAQIYLSNETYNIAKELRNKMHEMQLCIENRSRDTFEDEKKLKAEISELMEKLIKQMKDDLEDNKIF